MGGRFVRAALVLVLGLSSVACDGATTSSGPTTGCIPNPYTLGVTGGATGEVSSVTVQAGDKAVDERTNPTSPWCDTSELSLTKLDVVDAVHDNGCPWQASATALPCQPYGMLAALEIEPSAISFPASAQPSLVYDLVSNPRQTECHETCNLYVYQLRDPAVPGMSKWRPQIPATAGTDTSTSRAIATANINHFSVFALVELPDPEAIPAGGGDAVLIVASDFLDEDPNAVTVQLAFVEGNLDTSRQLEKESSPLFRFVGFELGSSPDPACEGTSGTVMTCLFPEGTEVRLQILDNGLVRFERLADGLVVEFSAAVEIL